jgi:hypothetical protein
MCTFTLADWASIATIFGAVTVPVTIIIYIVDRNLGRKKERKQQAAERERKEMETFNNLGAEWRDYLKLCLEYPELNVTDKHSPVNNPGDESTAAKRKIMYELLMSMFESAFLQYNYHTNEIKTKQWIGWKNYLEDWLDNDLFFEYCERIIAGKYYSVDFCNYLDKLMKKIRPGAAHENGKGKKP